MPQKLAAYIRLVVLGDKLLNADLIAAPQESVLNLDDLVDLGVR